MEARSVLAIIFAGIVITVLINSFGSLFDGNTKDVDKVLSEQRITQERKLADTSNALDGILTFLVGEDTAQEA